MTTLIAEFKSGCGCFGSGVGKAEQLTTHHPASHSRQAVRPHVTTLDPEAVFGHKQMCFMGSVCVLWGSLILLSSKLWSLNHCLFCFY